MPQPQRFLKRFSLTRSKWRGELIKLPRDLQLTLRWEVNPSSETPPLTSSHHLHHYDEYVSLHRMIGACHPKDWQSFVLLESIIVCSCLSLLVFSYRHRVRSNGIDERTIVGVETHKRWYRFAVPENPPFSKPTFLLVKFRSVEKGY